MVVLELEDGMFQTAQGPCSPGGVEATCDPGRFVTGWTRISRHLVENPVQKGLRLPQGVIKSGTKAKRGAPKAPAAVKWAGVRNPASRLRTRRHDLRPGRSGHECHVSRGGQRPALGPVTYRQRGRDRRAPGRALLWRRAASQASRNGCPRRPRWIGARSSRSRSRRWCGIFMRSRRSRIAF